MTQRYDARDPVKPPPNAPVLGIGLPTRKLMPPEFMMCFLQMLSPLGVKLAYIVQKGQLPAEARNSILDRALSEGMRAVLFLDDDVLYPPLTVYRLWSHLQQHPEAAAITGVVPTKIEPTEPMLYRDLRHGAEWDWALGDLIPIHGAGAGCLMVNLDYVRRFTAPWFQDQQSASSAAFGSDYTGVGGMLGHDRYFLAKLQEVGGVVYADTGILCGHFDVDLDKVFTLGLSAPCFQRPIAGECFVPTTRPDGVLVWSRLLRQGNPAAWLGYLDWVRTQEDVVQNLIPEPTAGQMLGHPVAA